MSRETPGPHGQPGELEMDPRSLREDGNGPFARRSGWREWLRLLGALHGLAFFFAVTVPPHRHFNSLDDLLSDGPSDSGIFVEMSSSQGDEAGLAFRSARLVDDDACLACFHNDFQAATEAVSVFLLSADPSPLARSISLPLLDEPPAQASRTRSRAPPTA